MAKNAQMITLAAKRHGALNGQSVLDIIEWPQTCEAVKRFVSGSDEPWHWIFHTREQV